MGIIITLTWRFVGRPRRWYLKMRPGKVLRARGCSQPVLFWRMVLFGTGSEITITSQEIFAVRDFQETLHQNGSERERGDTRKNKRPSAFYHIFAGSVSSSPGFHLRTWGPGGLF